MIEDGRIGEGRMTNEARLEGEKRSDDGEKRVSESEGARAMLELVLASPRAVAARDERAWLELFTPDARIEDPVGGAICGDPRSRAAFWQSFIEPQERIELIPIRDFVGVHSIVRQVHIATKMPLVTEPVGVPAIIEYRIDGSRISGLRAFWSVTSATSGLLSRGWSGWNQMMRQNAILTARLGGRGVLGFAAAMRPAIAERRARAWLNALVIERDAVSGSRVPGSCLARLGGAPSVEALVCAGKEVAAIVRGEHENAIALILRTRGGELENVDAFELLEARLPT